MTTDNYDASASLTAYYPSRDGRTVARLWSREKILHDLADLGVVEFFEGGGSNPTLLSGYAADKLWLRVDEGVTTQSATVRAFAGGDPSLLASWPETDRASIAAHLNTSGGLNAYLWSASTSGDPGSGRVSVNNATLSAATIIRASKTGRSGQSLAAQLGTIQIGDVVRIYAIGGVSGYLDAYVTSETTDNSTYVDIPVEVRAASAFTSGDTVELDTYPTVDVTYRGTYTILAMGQSNINNTQTYSWTPPSNLEFWNWDGTESGVGTAFAALPGTQAAFPFSFAAEVARMNPNTRVRLVRISFGGKPIEQWLGGWKYLWSSTTTSGDPGSGNIRFNNATASAVTEIYVSYYDKDGYDKQGSTGDTGVSASDNKLRIYKPADPAAYIEYTISSIVNVSTTHKTYTVTHAQTVGSVSLADTNEIRMLRSPDLYYALDRNMTAAISAAGFDKIDLMLWWQGESNVRSEAAYPDEFDELVEKLRGEAWYDYATPVVVCMHSPFSASAFAAMSNTMQQVVGRDVDTRAIVNPGALPVSFWDPADGYIHMLPEGYMRAGEMCARAYYTTGRATVDGITKDGRQ